MTVKYYLPKKTIMLIIFQSKFTLKSQYE